MIKKKTALLLSAILTFSLLQSALAKDLTDFTDVSGHWAAETLRRGYDDGLLQGFEDGTLRPDEPITAAQMITILCRVLNAPDGPASPSVPADAWYAKAAGGALALGLISADDADLDVFLPRQDALSMLARAFRLTPASPDLSSIEGFSDYGDIRAENRAALSALFSSGYIQGFDGSLSVSSGITRAEFISVLYRIAESFVPAATLSSVSGSAVLSGNGSLWSGSFSESLWFDCTADTISLAGVTAKGITLLSPAVKSLSLQGSTLSLLALAGSCDSLSLTGSSAIDTLRACGALKAALDGSVKNIEITGSSAEIDLSGSHGSLIISGSGNTVTLASDCTLKQLIISGSSNQIRFSAGSSAEAVSVSGSGNELSGTVGEDSSGEALVGKNSAKSVSLSGSKNKLTFYGEILDVVSLSGAENSLLLTSDSPLKAAAVSGESNWLTLTCTDMDSISIDGIYNTVHKCASGAVGSISIPGSSNAFRLYTGNTAEKISVTGKSNSIIIDGSASAVTIDGSGSTLSGAGRAGVITVNVYGCEITLPADSVSDNGLAAEGERVLALVSSVYQGNFTLKWAEEHDYEDFEKEVFVNVKGYTSDTDYLIWVNLAMQRVNIFEGSKENWKLMRSSIVGTGATRSQTPVGVYYTTYKQEAGWTTSTYTCRPVVGFYKGTGYAFHSRLYYPRTSTLTDAQIGYPVSHGCVRMYDEDVWYIYNSIPLGTTVVVY